MACPFMDSPDDDRPALQFSVAAGIEVAVGTHASSQGADGASGQDDAHESSGGTRRRWGQRHNGNRRSQLRNRRENRRGRRTAVRSRVGRSDDHASDTLLGHAEGGGSRRYRGNRCARLGQHLGVVDRDMGLGQHTLVDLRLQDPGPRLDRAQDGGALLVGKVNAGVGALQQR